MTGPNCKDCEKPTPGVALVAGHWYCLHHTRDLAQHALEQRDSHRAVLLRIATQGAGLYRHGTNVLTGVSGEPWVHWAQLAREELHDVLMTETELPGGDT